MPLEMVEIIGGGGGMPVFLSSFYEQNCFFFLVNFFFFLILSYGDVTPVNEYEYILCTICMLIGSSVWAYVVGSACGIVSTLDPHAVQFHQVIFLFLFPFPPFFPFLFLFLSFLFLF